MPETTSPVIELRDVMKSYGNSPVLQGFSLSLMPGQIVGLVGPNGVGKTTAMRILMGQTLPDSGDVLWHGEAMTRSTVKKVGYLPEERDLHQKMVVRSQLEFASRLNGASWEHASDYVEQVLYRLGLTDRAESSLNTLSLGAQQRVQLAAALVHNPQALILDEPDSGLDGESADLMRTVLTEIASRGVPVLITSHRMQFVKDTCSHLAVMIDGSIRAVGPISEILGSGARQFRVSADRLSAGWTRTVHGASEIESHPGRSTVELAPGVDEQRLLNTALEYGPLSEFTPLEPPLDDLYHYIADITRDGRVLGTGFVHAPLPGNAESTPSLPLPEREEGPMDVSVEQQSSPQDSFIPEYSRYEGTQVTTIADYDTDFDSQTTLYQHQPEKIPSPKYVAPEWSLQTGTDPHAESAPLSSDQPVDSFLGTNQHFPLSGRADPLIENPYVPRMSPELASTVDLQESSVESELPSVPSLAEENQIHYSDPLANPLPVFTTPGKLDSREVLNPLQELGLPPETEPYSDNSSIPHMPPAPPTRISTIPSREVDPATVAQRVAVQQPSYSTVPSAAPLPPPTPAPSHTTPAHIAEEHNVDVRVAHEVWEDGAADQDTTTGNTWWSRFRGRPLEEG